MSPLEAHDRSIIVFVTCCSAKKLPILASSTIHAAILNAWSTASTWLVGRYVVMPNHVHFFCAPNSIDAPSLERWMRYWKVRNNPLRHGYVTEADDWPYQGELNELRW